MQTRPLALRVTVILVAAVLMTAFVVREHRSGALRGQLRSHQLPVDSPETPLPQQQQRTDDPHHPVLVIDRFGSGDLITIDSLTRRVQYQRMLHSGTKSAMPSWRDQQEEGYLDSLLKAHPARP